MVLNMFCDCGCMMAASAKTIFRIIIENRVTWQTLRHRLENYVPIPKCQNTQGYTTYLQQCRSYRKCCGCKEPSRHRLNHQYSIIVYQNLTLPPNIGLHTYQQVYATVSTDESKKITLTTLFHHTVSRRYILRSLWPVPIVYVCGIPISIQRSPAYEITTIVQYKYQLQYSSIQIIF